MAAEYVPPTHDVQEELAGSALYMPAVHGTQDAGSFCPASELNVPATQLVHGLEEVADARVL